MKSIDPRLKIYLIILNTLVVLLISSPLSMALAVILAAVVVYFSRIRVSAILKSVGFVMAVAFIISLVLMIWIRPVTALFCFLKCAVIISCGFVFSKTTEQIDVLDGVAGAFHLRASTAKWVYLSIDFLPQLRHELDRVKTSRVARGDRPEGQGWFKSFIGDVRVFGPAWKNTNVRVKRSAKAMDDRCYDVTTRRIRTKPLEYKRIDFLCLAVSVIYFALIIFLEIRIVFYGKLI